LARAVPRDTARKDLAALGDVLAQARGVFVVEVVDLLDAERTDFALRLAVFGCALLHLRFGRHLFFGHLERLWSDRSERNFFVGVAVFVVGQIASAGGRRCGCARRASVSAAAVAIA